MAVAEVRVKVMDMPQVRKMASDAADLIGRLRSLLREWEPRVTCPQCGQRYRDRACGPTHAAVWALVTGGVCCDLHGRNCEPPSELCCGDCTEARHACWADSNGNWRHGHPPGEECSNPDMSGVTA